MPFTQMCPSKSVVHFLNFLQRNSTEENILKNVGNQMVTLPL